MALPLGEVPVRDTFAAALVWELRRMVAMNAVTEVDHNAALIEDDPSMTRKVATKNSFKKPIRLQCWDESHIGGPLRPMDGERRSSTSVQSGPMTFPDLRQFTVLCSCTGWFITKGTT